MNIPKHKESSAIAGLTALADPDAKEGICPLCGSYGYVNRYGYCGTEECSEMALDRARREVPSAVRKYGDLTVLNLKKLHRYGEPDYSHLEPAKEDHKCQIPGCDEIARPRDSLCNQCRRENPKIPKVRREMGLKHRPFAALRSLKK